MGEVMDYCNKCGAKDGYYTGLCVPCFKEVDQPNFKTRQLIRYSKRLKKPVPLKTALCKLNTNDNKVLMWLWIAGVIGRTIKLHKHSRQLVPYFYSREGYDDTATVALLSDVLWSS